MRDSKATHPKNSVDEDNSDRDEPASIAIEWPAKMLGSTLPQAAAIVDRFCRSVASMLDTWIQRTNNPNTQRTYRTSVMSFVRFLGLEWPAGSHEILGATVPDVRAWRDSLAADGKAPSTVNTRLSALSGFYRFMSQVSAIELGLPVQVPNPAHAQFIGRENPKPVSSTSSLTVSEAYRLLTLPSRNHLLKHDVLLARRVKEDDAALEAELEILVARDRAILATLLYTGARMGPTCALRVADFRDDEDDPTISFQERRPPSRRRVGVNFVCAEALRDYLERSGLREGPLFRARSSSRSARLGSRAVSQSAMYRLLLSYLARLPGAMVEEELPNGTRRARCGFSPRSLRVTTVTLLDEAGVSVQRIQELLGHKDIRATRAYIKLPGNTKKSASHDVPV